LDSFKNVWPPLKQKNIKFDTSISVPNIRVGHCLGPEGNGVSSGEGGEGGLGPPSREGDKQSTSCKEGSNMEQEEEGRTSQA
jgi:hypothetical protein